MNLEVPAKCLRNDGGTIIRSMKDLDPRLRRCDVCDDASSAEILRAVRRSTWEALRLGYRPTERKAWGSVARLTLTFNKYGPVFTEDYPPELQSHFLAFKGLRHAGEH